MLCVLIKSPFTCQRETEDKKADGFQISHFARSFSTDIVAVEGFKKTSEWMLVTVTGLKEQEK